MGKFDESKKTEILKSRFCVYNNNIIPEIIHFCLYIQIGNRPSMWIIIIIQRIWPENESPRINGKCHKKFSISFRCRLMGEQNHIEKPSHFHTNTDIFFLLLIDMNRRISIFSKNIEWIKYKRKFFPILYYIYHKDCHFSWKLLYTFVFVIVMNIRIYL